MAVGILLYCIAIFHVAVTVSTYFHVICQQLPAVLCCRFKATLLVGILPYMTGGMTMSMTPGMTMSTYNLPAF